MTTIALEQLQNNDNWKIANREASYKKRFLARKIHKLKKMLKLSKRSLSEHKSNNTVTIEESQNMQNESMECWQNEQNELLELDSGYYKQEKYNYDLNLEEYQNMKNENWLNWDQCCPCMKIDYDSLEHQYRETLKQNSICFVLMPNEPQPIPVKLRSAKIPGGFMWVSYGSPDLDIYSRHNFYSVTSSQIPEQQCPPSILI